MTTVLSSARCAGRQVHTPGRRPPPAPSSRCGRPRRRGRPAPGPAPPRRHPLRPRSRAWPRRPGVERGHALPGSGGREPGEVGVLRLQAGHRLRPRGGVAHAGLVQLVGARPTFCPSTTRTETSAPCSATFWWMVLLAKRVSCCRCPEQHLRLVAPMAFRGHAGQATDRLLTVHLVPFPLAPGCRAGRPTASPHLDARKRRGRPVAHVGHLHRLPLAAVGRPPPATPAPRRRSPPELGGDPGVGGVAVELAQAPSLISRHHSVPNWKLSRRSSMLRSGWSPGTARPGCPRSGPGPTDPARG